MSLIKISYQIIIKLYIIIYNNRVPEIITEGNHLSDKQLILTNLKLKYFTFLVEVISV